jgi:L-ascorbate metabolism protein UlaG (beta-lactamase superfamily)
MAADRLTWLGHATVLLELGGARFVTDPVLRARVAHLRREVPRPGRSAGSTGC